MERFELAKRLAQETGAFLGQSYGKSHKARRKKDGTIVTDADVEAERRIVQAIHRTFPHDAVVAEEGGGRSTGPSGFTWYVDPLDGTGNFSFGIPIFAVSIAFEDKEGIVGAAVSLPMFDVLVDAKRGEGTFWNGRRLHVAPEPNTRDPLVLLSYGRAARDDARIKAFLASGTQYRLFGSAVFSFCLLAAGAANGYLALHLHPWDYAAGILFVTEAGGITVFPDGSPATVSGLADILAGSPDAVKMLAPLLTSP